MKNQDVYETIQNIVESPEMKAPKLDHLHDAIVAVNDLRTTVKELISIIYISRAETKEVKKIASMLQKIERAKARYIEQAIDNSLREDHVDIMSYDARNKSAVQISTTGRQQVGKIDL